jgi:hypothetical protein
MSKIGFLKISTPKDEDSAQNAILPLVELKLNSKQIKKGKVFRNFLKNQVFSALNSCEYNAE